MSNSMDRLKALNVTPRQAEQIFEVPRDILAEALEQSPPPRWLSFCLEGLERVLPAITEQNEPEAGPLSFLSPDREREPAIRQDDPPASEGRDPLENAAMKLLPLLIQAAVERNFVSLDAIDDALSSIAPELAGERNVEDRIARPLGVLCEAILTLSEKSNHVIPPLAALAVREDGLPPDDLDEYLRIYLIETDHAGPSMRMSHAREEIIREHIFPAIFAFPYWDDIEASLSW